MNRTLLLLAAACTFGCATSGSTWMAQPLSTEAWKGDPPPPEPAPASDEDEHAPPGQSVTSRKLKDATAPPDTLQPITPAGGGGGAKSQSLREGGRVLGTFRNTYYDFPSENDFSGETIALKNGHCKTIKQVARSFYEAVCVQGSGTLAGGSTVSFAKRDCDCAALCPRTDQHICFDELDAKAYPWGRGATGKPITPLLTVAVDTDLVPLDTPIYIPEFDGVPRDASKNSLHDGCFLAQDRGVRVKGEHVDIFTGHHETTALWNGLVPSNQGVTIVLESPHCARAAATP